AHLYGIPTTMFRFFTVYGPWGRPDMALFRFVKAILAGEAIDVYNHGEMRRDFTYVDDLVEGVVRLIEAVPDAAAVVGPMDSLSPVAPWRVVNIGNGAPVPLMAFVAAIEAALGRQAVKNFLPMQPGDVPATWADATLIEALVGPLPRTDIAEGVRRFVDWYREYYRV
ncbi:MAG TPA: NAD-dependent epimerase/dehydratase family protein, partial [Paracoccaceae bacterium]